MAHISFCAPFTRHIDPKQSSCIERNRQDTSSPPCYGPCSGDERDTSVRTSTLSPLSRALALVRIAARTRKERAFGVSRLRQARCESANAKSSSLAGGAAVAAMLAHGNESTATGVQPPRRECESPALTHLRRGECAVLLLNTYRRVAR